MLDCPNNPSQLDHFALRLEANAYKNRIPLRGTFELTARCNFNCKMCYVHLTESQIKSIGRELTNEEWLDIAQQAKDAGMLYLTLTGGEVFARPKFRELYESLSDMGFLIQIFSNGYLVDEKVIKWLEKRPPMALRFTLYGATNETYEAVCGVKDGFDRVSHAVNLVKQSGIPFYMAGLILKENWHEYEQMCIYARDAGVIFQPGGAVLNPVRGATADAASHRMNLNDYLDDEIMELITPRNKQKHLLEYCGSYRKGFAVTWNGNMQLCVMSDTPRFSLLENSFAASWLMMNERIDNLCMPKQCEDCKYEPFCVRCPGLLMSECGSFTEMTEDFCNRAKLLYERYQRKVVSRETEG